MLLKKLSEARGVSGDEKEVRDIIRAETRPYADTSWTDHIGNLYVQQDGKGPRICLLAHMDEVGLMITGKDKEGLYHFDVVGGMRDEVLPSAQVKIGPHGIGGVVGISPFHLQKGDARNAPVKREQLRIDTGDDKTGSVEIGQTASFATRFRQRGRLAFGKAFDDRLGCLCMIEALKQSLGAQLTCVFTVQEEVGLRGSLAAAEHLECDVAIACEGTFSVDLPGTPAEERMPVMGSGPTLTISDRTAISDRTLLRAIESAAHEGDIPYQYKRPMAGGTDIGALMVKGKGVPSCVIAVPCRYIHAPCSMADTDDIKNTGKLVCESVRRIMEEY